MTMRFNVIVFTALGLETAAVLRHLRNVEQEAGPNWLHVGFTVEGARIAVCEVGPGNLGAAAAAAATLVVDKPSIAAFVGVAGGVKDIKLGDVVVATKVYGYESGKEKADGFRPRPSVQTTSHSLEQNARAARQRADWHSRLDPTRWPDAAPSVLVEPIAAGEKVVASNRGRTATFLREVYGDAVAVEMEGRGFLEAVHIAGDIQGVVVRGISDMLKGKARSDAADWQPKAADAAAAFLFAILARHAVRASGADLSPPLASGGGAEERLDERILNGSNDLVEALTTAVRRDAPGSYTQLVASLSAAKRAFAVSDKAVEQAAAARAMSAGSIPPHSRLKFKTKNPRLFALREGLGACIWDSADEYYGQFGEGHPFGLGVYKIYQVSREMLPDQVAFFKGEVRSERELGPLGVYEFDTSTTFAGEWHNSRPRKGYLSYTRPDAPFAFYFGDIREMGDKTWVPHGNGIGISTDLKEVACGEFVDGLAGRANVGMTF